MSRRVVSRLSAIKSAQKESVILRAVAPLLHEITRETPELQGLYVTRTQLTPGKSLCYIYLYSPEGEAHYRACVEAIKLYIPSIRKAVAHTLNSRRAPDILFAYDAHHEKVCKLEELMDRVKAQDESAST